MDARRHDILKSVRRCRRCVPQGRQTQLTAPVVLIALALGAFGVIGTIVKSANQPTFGSRTGAVCNDGTRSSATGQGACSWHGGVDYWIRPQIGDGTVPEWTRCSGWSIAGGVLVGLLSAGGSTSHQSPLGPSRPARTSNASPSATQPPVGVELADATDPDCAELRVLHLRRQMGSPTLQERRKTVSGLLQLSGLSQHQLLAENRVLAGSVTWAAWPSCAVRRSIERGRGRAGTPEIARHLGTSTSSSHTP